MSIILRDDGDRCLIQILQTTVHTHFFMYNNLQISSNTPSGTLTSGSSHANISTHHGHHGYHAISASSDCPHINAHHKSTICHFLHTTTRQNRVTHSSFFTGLTKSERAKKVPHCVVGFIRFMSVEYTRRMHAVIPGVACKLAGREHAASSKLAEYRVCIKCLYNTTSRVTIGFPLVQNLLVYFTPREDL